MVDITQILNDLQQRADAAMKDIDVDAKIDDAKGAAMKVKERLETDETARNLTIGGGVLLAALLATRGGRRLTGNVAKTGAVAALGALAYKAWQDRANPSADAAKPLNLDTLPSNADVEEAGFVIDPGSDPAFARALVHTMAVAAYADGVVDPSERAAIDGIVSTDGEDLTSLVDGSGTRAENLDLIALAASSPNHAAQLYAAAVVATASQSHAESSFLEQLAERLGIAPAHKAAIERGVAG